MTRDERRQFWRGHFQAWAAGDESQAAYCRRHGLSPMSFSQWKRRFERQRLHTAVGGSGDEEATPLVEVRVADDEAPVEASGVTVAIYARVRVYALIETAKANAIDPYGYLAHLFTQLPRRDLDAGDPVDDLLPWNVNLPDPATTH